MANKAKAKILDAGSIKVQMTFTFTMNEWTSVYNRLRFQEGAPDVIATQIYTILDSLEKTFESCEEVKKEGADA